MSAYDDFLARKAQLGSMSGFEPTFQPDFLFDFQHALTDWAIRKGRSALFADCGLGKTPMLLTWAENVVRHTNRPVLVLTPLAVSYQTLNEAEKFEIEAHRTIDGKVWPGINVTNYERLHHFSPDDFAGVVCDESSILKSFDGARKAEITEFMRQVQYRLLDTATAAPNDYIELGTSSEALGELGYTDMLGRFFKNDQNTIKPMRFTGFGSPRASSPVGGEHTDKWRFKGHAEKDFWRWVASWARAMRRPSDLGFCDERFVLPPLYERDHVVDVPEDCLPDGALFAMPATGLKEQREERRRTIGARCAKVVELVGERRREPSLVWCHLNEEGDRLERAMPHAVQVAGKDSDDYKERAAMWFAGSLCLCNEPLFRAKLPAWRSENQIQNTFEPITTPIARSDLLRPSSMLRPTLTKNELISGLTIRPTNIGTPNGHQNGKPNTTQNGEKSTATVRLSENSARPKPKTIELENQKFAGQEILGALASPWADTTPFLRNREGDAPSAFPPTAGTHEQADSMLTTVTSPEGSGAYFALDATLGLVSSKTTPKDLSAPQCTCGHASGKRVLISKQSMFGWGLNFQACAHVTTFPSHSFEQYYQGIRRCWRFGQTRPVVVDIVTSEGEASVMANLQRKALAADRMFTELVAHMNDALKIERAVEFTKKEKVPAWL